MPGTLQTFLAAATTKAADQLIAAFERLPEDKQNWSPEGKARTALNQIAEVAILNGQTADIVKTRAWPSDYSFDAYFKDHGALSQDAEGAISLLRETTPKAAAAILDVPDDALIESVTMPWGPMLMSELVAYPYWNMHYHTGQINYIASMLGIAF